MDWKSTSVQVFRLDQNLIIIFHKYVFLTYVVWEPHWELRLTHTLLDTNPTAKLSFLCACACFCPQPQDIPAHLWHPSDKAVLISMRRHLLTPEGKAVGLVLVRMLQQDRVETASNKKTPTAAERFYLSCGQIIKCHLFLWLVSHPSGWSVWGFPWPFVDFLKQWC